MQAMNKVKGFRAMLGLTQEELANKLGMERSVYNRKESAQNFTQAEKIALEHIFKEMGINEADASEF